MQLVTQHQKIRKRVQFGLQRRFTLVVVLIERDRELEETVVQHDRRQRIDVRFGQRLFAEHLAKLLEEPRRGKVRMIHKIPEAVRIGRFLPDRIAKVFLRNVVRRTEPLCDPAGQQCFDGIERTGEQFCKVRFCRVAHAGQAIEVAIGKE